MSSLKIYNGKVKEWRKATSMMAASHKVVDLAGHYESENVEGCLQEIAEDMDEMKGHIKYIYQNGTIGGGPGDGGSSVPTIKIDGAVDNDGVHRRVVKSDEDVVIYYFFNSPNPGNGTVRLANGDTVIDQVIKQGRQKWNAGKFKRGIYNLSISVEDAQGFVSEPARVEITSGAIELTSTFSDAKDFSLQDDVTIPYRIATEIPGTLTAEYILDGEKRETIVTKGDNSWKIGNLPGLGPHTASIRVYSEAATSNILNFNLVASDSENLFVSTTFREKTWPQGKRLQLDYRISMKGQYSFRSELHLDGVLVDTVNNGPGVSFWDLGTELPLGLHRLRVVSMTTDKQFRDELELEVEIVEAGLIQVVEPAGMIAKFNASGKMNGTDTSSIWEDKSGNNVKCNLRGFNFITNGWKTDEETQETALTFAGKTYAEIDLAPFKNGIEVGFTFDIVYKVDNTGNTEGRVVECKNSQSPFQGFMINTERALFESKQAVKSHLEEGQWTRTTFVVDRVDRKMKVYTNAIISNGAILGDRDPDKDEFQFPGKIILGAGYDAQGRVINNSTSSIKMVRIYDRALTSKEVLDLHMYDIKNADELNAINELNYGELAIPTLELTGPGIENLEGGMDPLTVKVSYKDPLNPSKRLNRDFCMIEVQGTTSKDYPVKNFTLFMRDQQAQPDRSWTPNDNWMPEERWTLKTNFMDSSHGNNVGLNKFIHDLFKENPYPQQIGEKGTKRRSNIDGFPTKVFINGKDAGIYTFNIDRYAYNNYGLSDYGPDGVVSKVNNAVQYEVAVNSTNGAGAFLNNTWDNIRREWKHRYNYRNGSPTEKIGTETVLAEGMHGELVDMITWVMEADDNAFRAELDDWFSIPHLIDYYLVAYAFGMIDNLGKNMVMTTFGQNEQGNTIWYPSFYDCDSVLGLANNGEIRYDAGVDMSGDAFNTRNSALWVKLKRNFEQEIQNRYYALRAPRKLSDGTVLPPVFSAENAMNFIDGEIMSRVGQSYYNNDAERKYLDGRTLGNENNPDAPRPGQTWIQCCNGNRREFTTRWLKERFIYLDSVFQTNSYTSKTMILRTHVLGPVRLKLKSYSPQWFTIKYSSAKQERVYVSRDRDYDFNVSIDNDTENDFTIYGADNLMYLLGMEQLFVSHINIAGATKLIEVNCSESPNIKGIAIGSDNKYLQKVIANNCPKLGLEIENKEINLTGCPNLKEVNLSATKVRTVSLPREGGVLEEFNCENTLLERLDLAGQEYLESLRLAGCKELAEVYLTSCNGLTEVRMPNTILTKFSIVDCKNIEVIDISNTTRLENIDLRGCPNLRELNLTGVVSKMLTDLDLTSSLKLEKLILTNMAYIDCVTFGKYIDENDNLQNYNALKYFDCKNSSIRTIRYGLASEKPAALDLTGLILDYVTFESCPNISHIKGINIQATGSMAPFKQCRNLTTIEGRIKLKDAITQAFWNCNKLTNLSSGKLTLDLKEVSSMSDGFAGCSSLTMNDLKFIMKSLGPTLTGSTWRAFSGCSNIKGSLPSDLFATTTGITSLNETFTNCIGITGALPTNLLLPMKNLRDCDSTFYGCTGITGAIPETFFNGPGSSLQITEYMFYGCIGLTDIPANNIFSENANLSNCAYMFSGCTGITGRVPGTIFEGKEKLIDVSGFFNGCSGVWGDIPRTIFRHCSNSENSRLKYISNFFRGTSVEGSIPIYISNSDKGIFDDLPYLENASYVFPITISGVIPGDLFKYNPRLSEINGLFSGCTLLEGEIPERLLSGKDKLKSANALFKSCSGINSTIPRKLFEGCVLLTDIKELFSGCTSLAGQIPARITRIIEVPGDDPDTVVEVEEIVEYGIFDYCTSLRDASNVFASCIKLNGRIPEELFVSANQVIDLSGAFTRCYELSGPIPAKLLKNCSLLQKANSMFADCCKLGRTRESMTEEDPYAIPAEFFESCRELVEASACFSMWGEKPQGSVLIGQIPSTLFRNNRKLKNINTMFAAAPIEGTLPGNLFLTNSELLNCESAFASSRLTGVGKELLRGHQKIKNVTQMFWNSSQISGEVPALWDIGGLTGTGCYRGLNSNNVSNWADIPENWK